MIISEAIDLGIWEEFFWTGTEKLPKNSENLKLYLSMDKGTLKWVLVTQSIKNKNLFSPWNIN